jgi:hypothetical protein
MMVMMMMMMMMMMMPQLTGRSQSRPARAD